MPSSRARIRLWCEDARHERFAKALLEEQFHVDPRGVTVQKPPKGRGAASAWVLARYKDVVIAEVRRARRQESLGFLVIVDGDNCGLKGRIEQFESAAPNSRKGERIAIWAPTWSIETWVLWLSGQDVTESEPVKSLVDDSTFRGKLALAIQHWQDPRPGEATVMPSLASARAELANLPLRNQRP